MSNKTSKKSTKKSFRKWSREEDERLFHQVSAFPQNLSKCFIMVADDLGRTPGSVAYRWYNHVSKDDRYMAFFTASAKHLSKNRKNGFGISLKSSIWQKFLYLIKKI